MVNVKVWKHSQTLLHVLSDFQLYYPLQLLFEKCPRKWWAGRCPHNVQNGPSNDSIALLKEQNMPIDTSQYHDGNGRFLCCHVWRRAWQKLYSVYCSDLSHPSLSRLLTCIQLMPFSYRFGSFSGNSYTITAIPANTAWQVSARCETPVARCIMLLARGDDRSTPV